MICTQLHDSMYSYSIQIILCWDPLNVMVIAVGNGIMGPSSNPGWGSFTRMPLGKVWICSSSYE